MSELKHKTFRRGDTMIEVLISFAIFSFVAMISMNTMGRGVAQSQRTLEITMARNAMDMQAETVRFWHEAASGSGANPQYVTNWNALVGQAISRTQYTAARNEYINNFNNGNCPAPVGSIGALTIGGHNPFVVNSRNIVSTTPVSTNQFSGNVAFPQLVYGTGTNRTDNNLVGTSTALTEVQGVFAFIVKERDINPRYYDIHVHTCWRDSRLETTTRLTTPGL